MTSYLNHSDIRVGTLAPFDRGLSYLSQMVVHGFESFELTSWAHIGGVNIEELAPQVLDLLEGRAIISTIGIYGNPLQDEQTAKDWARMIKAAKLYGASAVCGFAGALEDRPVDESIEKFKEVFTPLAQLASDEGVKIAFENCDMGGNWERPKWNIAHSPRAWEMMFNAVEGDTLGLEWEPCHQMGSFVDPMPQLKKWVDRVYHVHGKDATMYHDVIAEFGTRSGLPVCHHRTPGFGDSNWTDIISILRRGGFVGAIDIEGWHDPVYCNELETTGQIYGLNYLKQCRGGVFVSNPIA